MNTNYPRSLTPLPISRRRIRELARADDHSLQPLDGRRVTLNRKRMVIRNCDGIWNVYFGSLKLGRLHEQHKRIEDEYDVLNHHKVQPMFPDFLLPISPVGQCFHEPYSHLSLAFAAFLVCHCILLGSSRPPRFRGTMWSTTYPGRPFG